MNWRIRLKNPVFWGQMALSVITPVLAYYGLTGADLTSWPLLLHTLLCAIKNPYVCIGVLVSVWNACNDPTTKGLADSSRALSYRDLG